ncbi:Protein CBG10239 [Caenorhabditis briggsae]|nr:Protein CBG10239 [Caenorhabditis briggsae]CAP29740.2 Protein CBG10239 [Caenorhabditis briggsae]
MTTIPNFPKGWTTEVETALIDFVEGHPELWKLMRFAEVTDEHKKAFAIIQPILNNEFQKEYTVDMVAQKWCELSLLFDVKFAINGYTMKPRTNVYYKDGRIKDDLAEYWVHFPRIGAFMGDKPEMKQEVDDEDEEVDIKPDVSKLKLKFKK